jgi:hypothetical protein
MLKHLKEIFERKQKQNKITVSRRWGLQGPKHTL